MEMAPLAGGHHCDWPVPRRGPKLFLHHRGANLSEHRLDDVVDQQICADKCALSKLLHEVCSPQEFAFASFLVAATH